MQLKRNSWSRVIFVSWVSFLMFAHTYHLQLETLFLSINKKFFELPNKRKNKLQNITSAMHVEEVSVRKEQTKV